MDPLIANIFVQSQSSTVGAYAVRLYKNGQWEHVIVDDYFPCLADNQSDGLCAGAAFAHSDHMEEIWIALLEKAFAKYGKSVFILHVGGTRCVTSSTDNIMNIRARITLTVEVIRTCIFIFSCYV